MSLTINGSGGGITAPDVTALTGWNVLAEKPIDSSGTTTGGSVLFTFASLGVDLTPWSEVRYRFEIDSSNSSLTISNYAGVFIGLSTNPSATNPSVSAGFNMGGMSTYNSSFTAQKCGGQTLPLAKTITTGNSNYGLPEVTFIGVGYAGTSITSLDVVKYVARNGSSTMSYRLKGTVYLEGRK